MGKKKNRGWPVQVAIFACQMGIEGRKREIRKNMGGYFALVDNGSRPTCTAYIYLHTAVA